MTEETRERLRSGLAGLGLETTEETVAGLEEYVRMVREWNRRFNLVSRGDEEYFVERHVLDSAAPAGFIVERGLKRLVDVGSGAGLPGVPVYITSGRPEMVLLEPNRKKSLFLVEVKDILGLTGVRIERARVEELDPNERFDCALLRGLRWEGELAGAVGRILRPGGFLICYRSEGQGEPEGWDSFEAVERLGVELPGVGPRSYHLLRRCFT